jgi:dTMP kinase
LAVVYETLMLGNHSMFVTFEGPEGAGKSTALAAVAGMLRQDGHDVLCSREPGGGELGRKIRDLLLHGGELSAATELMLFLADRANHVESILRPALANGRLVLCDRYIDSTTAYQGYGRGMDIGFLNEANRFATDGLMPDLTILFDLPPEAGLARLRNKDRMDRQPIEYHQKVRMGFLELARNSPERFAVIDAQNPAELTAMQAFDEIGRKLNSVH